MSFNETLGEPVLKIFVYHEPAPEGQVGFRGQVEMDFFGSEREAYRLYATALSMFKNSLEEALNMAVRGNRVSPDDFLVWYTTLNMVDLVNERMKFHANEIYRLEDDHENGSPPKS